MYSEFENQTLRGTVIYVIYDLVANVIQLFVINGLRDRCPFKADADVDANADAVRGSVRVKFVFHQKQFS